MYYAIIFILGMLGYTLTGFSFGVTLFAFGAVLILFLDSCVNRIVDAILYANDETEDLDSEE